MPGFLFSGFRGGVDRRRVGAIYLIACRSGRSLHYSEHLIVPIIREISMTRFAAAVAIALASLLALSSCANTANGLAKDGRQMGNAVDESTHRVLKAGQN